MSSLVHGHHCNCHTCVRTIPITRVVKPPVDVPIRTEHSQRTSRVRRMMGVIGVGAILAASLASGCDQGSSPLAAQASERAPVTRPLAHAPTDTDGRPTRMVRIAPHGSTHVGAIKEMSARIGTRVLQSHPCAEDSAIGLSLCADWKRPRRAVVAYEKVNGDLINYSGSWVRVFVWAR
jgi:hypothetical protein